MRDLTMATIKIAFSGTDRLTYTADGASGELSLTAVAKSANAGRKAALIFGPPEFTDALEAQFDGRKNPFTLRAYQPGPERAINLLLNDLPVEAVCCRFNTKAQILGFDGVAFDQPASSESAPVAAPAEEVAQAAKPKEILPVAGPLLPRTGNNGPVPDLGRSHGSAPRPQSPVRPSGAPSSSQKGRYGGGQNGKHNGYGGKPATNGRFTAAAPKQQPATPHIVKFAPPEIPRRDPRQIEICVNDKRVPHARCGEQFRSFSSQLRGTQMSTTPRPTPILSGVEIEILCESPDHYLLRPIAPDQLVLYGKTVQAIRLTLNQAGRVTEMVEAMPQTPSASY